MKLLSSFFFIILLLAQFLTVIPFSIAISEPLVVVPDFRYSDLTPYKVFGRTYFVNTTLIVNSVVIFYLDGVREFDFGTAVLGNSVPIVSRNSTHVLLSKTIGQRYLRMYWQYIGDDFKMTLCWNLQNPVVLKLPITVFERFVNNTFVFKGLMFDWNDAVSAGFVVTYDQLVNSVSVSVPVSGCLDPTVSKVGDSTQTAPLDFTFSGRLLNMSGYWLAFFSKASNDVIQRSQTNVKYPATADWSGVVALTANQVLNGGWSVTNNASHIFEWDSRNNGSAVGRHTFRLFRFFPNGTFSGQQVETKISSKGANTGGTVLLNSTGYPHVFTSEHFGVSPTVHKLFLYRALDKSGVSFSSIDLGVSGRRQFYSMVNCGTVSGYDRFCMVYSSGTETSDLRMRMYYSNNMSVSAERLLGTDFSPTIWDIQGSSDATLHVAYKSNTNTTIRYANYTLEMSKTQKQVVSDVNIETQRASVAILKKNNTDDYTFVWMVKPTGGIYQNKTNSGRTFTNSSMLYALTGVSPGSSIAVQRECYQECALLFSNNTASSPVWFLNFGAFSNPSLFTTTLRIITQTITISNVAERLATVQRDISQTITISNVAERLATVQRTVQQNINVVSTAYYTLATEIWRYATQTITIVQSAFRDPIIQRTSTQIIDFVEDALGRQFIVISIGPPGDVIIQAPPISVDFIPNPDFQFPSVSAGPVIISPSLLVLFVLASIITLTIAVFIIPPGRRKKKKKESWWD